MIHPRILQYWIWKTWSWWLFEDDELAKWSSEEQDIKQLYQITQDTPDDNHFSFSSLDNPDKNDANKMQIDFSMEFANPLVPPPPTYLVAAQGVGEYPNAVKLAMYKIYPHSWIGTGCMSCIWSIQSPGWIWRGINMRFSGWCGMRRALLQRR